jgi:hypothetical protein
MTPEEFARRVRDEQRRLEDDEGDGRLGRQKRAIRFNHRVDPASGMIEFWGKFDPLRGLGFLNRLKARMGGLFGEKTPDDCPSDPLEKNAYLQALALLDLCEGRGTRGGRPEVIVVVDTRDSAAGEGPVVDWGIPVELPVKVLTDLVPRADAHTVIVRDGAIVHAPGRLNLGRTTRLANTARGEPYGRSTRGARSPTVPCASTTARSTTSDGGAMVAAPTSTTCCPCASATTRRSTTRGG